MTDYVLIARSSVISHEQALKMRCSPPDSPTAVKTTTPGESPEYAEPSQIVGLGGNDKDGFKVAINGYDLPRQTRVAGKDLAP